MMKKIINNRYFRYFLALVTGLFLGWLLFHRTIAPEKTTDQVKMTQNKEIWTCSMHPQIRMDKAGKCPICAMDLIPLYPNNTAVNSPVVQMSEEAIQLAQVSTIIVGKQSPVKDIRLYGIVQPDERMVQNQVAFLSGRIEKLLINFTGEPVVKGQKLAVIYSPQLVTAQQELIEAFRIRQQQPAIYQAAVQKLLQWKLQSSQIEEIEKSGQIQPTMEIFATTSGIVTNRRVNTGDYVSEGSSLYEVTDLSKVLVLFDAYESDLPFLKAGNPVTFALQAQPGISYSGNIRFIDPVVDQSTRVAKVRVEMNNRLRNLKPGMFVTGLVRSMIGNSDNQLVIPASAILWTGKRSLVYIKLPGTAEPEFEMREVTLGPKAGNGYIITSGLTEGEEIVERGTFSVDAAAQLEGKPSMMNPVEPGSDSPDTVKNLLKNQKNETKLMPSTFVSEQLKVSGKCDMCKERIEKATLSVTGVKSAIWNSGNGFLKITYDNTATSVDKIARAVAEAGHDNELFKAPDDVYNTLPECCHYRE